MKIPDHLVAGKVPPCRIWLDGIERQNGVIEANISQGWIIQFCPGADGRPVVVGDQFATEKLFGAVRAEWVDQYAGQRALLVQAVRNATAEPDESGGYLPVLADKIAAGEVAHIDTWIALDAIKLAQVAAFDPSQWTGWTERGEAWLAAGCPPIGDPS